MPYQAVVFDMDGVLVDSEPVFFDAVNDLLAPTGKRVEWSQYEKLLGTSMSVTWRGVLDAVGLGQREVERFIGGYGETLLAHLRKPRPPLPGVIETLDELGRRDTPVGLATSSREEWVEALMAAAGIDLGRFSATVWRQMVERGKPAPDLYLKAAELLGVAPERCVAVEDTPPGIAAAKAAGMYAVQVRAASSAGPPIEEANLVIENLAAFPMELLGP